MLDQITPVILTWNEAPNLGRSLERLHWAKQIVAIDSYSNDETLEILASYPQVQLFQREFDTHAQQWNYGLAQAKSQWVLSLDADYVLTEELIAEIQTISPPADIEGYLVKFKYCVFGQPLRGTLLPPRQVLFRREKGIYIDDGHTQLLQVSGKSAMLEGYIYHDDRKPLSRWLRSQDKYMLIEVKKLQQTPASQLSYSDRLRQKKVIAPLLILFYCLILKGGILDGWAGWYYAWQRMLAEILLAIRLIEAEQLAKSDRF